MRLALDNVIGKEGTPCLMLIVNFFVVFMERCKSGMNLTETVYVFLVEIKSRVNVA